MIQSYLGYKIGEQKKKKKRAPTFMQIYDKKAYKPDQFSMRGRTLKVYRLSPMLFNKVTTKYIKTQIFILLSLSFFLL